MEGERCRRLSNLRDGVFGMHVSGSGGRARGTLIHFAFCRSISTDWVEGRERVSVTLTLSGGSFSMHASGSGG